MFEYNGKMHQDLPDVSDRKFEKSHPIMNEKNHTKLMDFLRQRIEEGCVKRRERIPHYHLIEKAISGWMVLTPEDRKRAIKKYETGQPLPTMTNLPIMYIYVDDLVTYLSNIFAPARAMFYQTSSPGEVKNIQKIIQIMNDQAAHSSYYREVVLSLMNLVKFNEGGLRLRWESEKKITYDTDAQLSATSESPEWEGNCVESLDMYNTIWDPSCDPVDLHMRGEWAATVNCVSMFEFMQRMRLKNYYVPANYFEEPQKYSSPSLGKHFLSVPKFSKDIETQQMGDGFSWDSWLGQSEMFGPTQNQLEIMDIEIRLVAEDFGLSATKRPTLDRPPEVYCISVLNGERIVKIERKQSSMQYIDFYFGHMNDSGENGDGKSLASMVDPLQTFMNFLMNVHVQAARNSVAGNVFFDSGIFNVAAIVPGEPKMVGSKPGAVMKDIRNHLFVQPDTNQTQNTMNDIFRVMELLGVMFPGQAQPNQIASIDRATNSQVSAVQHGTSRRNHKVASVVDSLMFVPLRRAIFYNLLDKINGSEPLYGREGKVDFSTNEIQQADFSVVIGQGMKAIDQMLIADQLQRVIFALIQNPQAAQQFDIAKMIDFWSSMLNIEMDMTEFRLPPPAAVDPNNPDAPIEGTGVQPATNPLAVDQPIYGAGAT